MTLTGSINLITTLLLIAATAFAYNGDEIPGSGPYSTSMANSNENAIDPAIPGFVGPDGDGSCLTQGPNNYVNTLFKSWATGYCNYLPSDAVGFYDYDSIGNGFDNPLNALGPVTGDNFDIVSLGDMDTSEILSGKSAGRITLTFDQILVDGPGPDFAVFENGFISAGGAGVAGQIFGELGYVEVSTDGENFVRFPCDIVPFSEDLVGAYGTVEATCIRNLAGKHVNAYGESWGTPFDLEDLASEQAVKDGQVNLGAIHYVRIVDIPGNGSCFDSDGDLIYDAWVTWGSGGLDLEAVGIINNSESVVPGDADGNGLVNLDDFIILKQNYGREDTGWGSGDFNHDGSVSLDDFIILKQNYGN